MYCICSCKYLPGKHVSNYMYLTTCVLIRQEGLVDLCSVCLCYYIHYTCTCVPKLHCTIIHVPAYLSTCVPMLPMLYKMYIYYTCVQMLLTACEPVQCIYCILSIVVICVATSCVPMLEKSCEPVQCVPLLLYTCRCVAMLLYKMYIYNTYLCAYVTISTCEPVYCIVVTCVAGCLSYVTICPCVSMLVTMYLCGVYLCTYVTIYNVPYCFRTYVLVYIGIQVHRQNIHVPMYLCNCMNLCFYIISTYIYIPVSVPMLLCPPMLLRTS